MFFFFHRFLRVDFRLVSRTYFSFVSRGGDPGIPLGFDVLSLLSHIYYDIEDRFFPRNLPICYFHSFDRINDRIIKSGELE